MTMAIDGRALRPEPKPDAYESSGIKIAAVLFVAVPALFLLWLVYWIGSWTGGVWGGIGGVASTAVTVWALWMFRRRRRR